jgi:hypothetical protein
MVTTKYKVRRFFWNIFGWPDLPPRNFNVTVKHNNYTGKFYMPNYRVMGRMYSLGHDVEFIAKEFNVTRERVRQCIWKSYRECA